MSGDAVALVERFKIAAVAQGEADAAGSIVKANRASDRVRAIYLELRSLGEEALQLLTPLLDDADEFVRYSACYYCLVISPERALATLRSTHWQTPVIRLCVNVTLDLWSKGELEELQSRKR